MSAAPRPIAWHTGGLLLLTMATGIIDATSYLALDRVFTGNMTGNVLFIGFAVTGVPDIPLLNNVLALAGFFVGAVIGSRTIGKIKAVSLPRTAVWVLVATAVITVGSAGFWQLTGDITQVEMITMTTLLAGCMGAQVAAVKPIGNSDITTVVVTSTIANLARESRLAGHGQASHVWRHRVGAIVAMGVGAAIGAWTIKASGGPLSLVVAGAASVAALAALVVGTRQLATPPAS
jgi:uncharacterized membrane protein YoaK (UPF0700 family)